MDMQFKSFTLDPFQVEAIASIEKNNSVIVSAATGTGKTLIADYVIDKFLKEGLRVIYTAPIKALSNQKYRDFKKDYGEAQVGIITGDVQINTDAQILIMTTEIYRNMLLTKDPLIAEVRYVIFDEIHYISDIDRGVVWEEALIFSPEHLRFLCLSATIPNAEQFASWIHTIKKHQVDIVKYEKRAVPLTHLFYDYSLHLCEARELRSLLGSLEMRPKHGHKHTHPMVRPEDIIGSIKQRNLLPCFYFVFSRKQCSVRAKELARKYDFTTPQQKSEIIRTFTSIVPSELHPLESVQELRQIVVKGIGVHHAGLLPLLKEVMEVLFSKNLISVLFTTETFAVGINMPAKAVIFSSLQKYDGANFRYLNSKEYFQLAGRAGRRGIDTEGFAISIYDRARYQISELVKFMERDVEPIRSRFHLGINTVMHLIKYHTPEEREVLLRSNFDYFQQKSEGVRVRITTSFNSKVRMLQKLGYLTPELKLTDKGNFILHVYANELLLGEIFATDLHRGLTEVEIAVLVAAIIYEERKDIEFDLKDPERVAESVFAKVKDNQFVRKTLDVDALRKVAKLVRRWAEGCDFVELMQYTNMAEGDIVHLLLRTIDALRQLKRAAPEYDLGVKMDTTIRRLYRDIVVVEL